MGVMDKIKSMFGKATDVAGDVADKAKDVGGDAVGKAKDVAGDVADKAKDVAEDIKDRFDGDDDAVEGGEEAAEGD